MEESLLHPMGPRAGWPKGCRAGLGAAPLVLGALTFCATYDSFPPTEGPGGRPLDGLNGSVSLSSADSCSRFTDGTCRFLPCHSWRGATECVGGAFKGGKGLASFLEGTCKCKPGFCANDWGVCVPPPGSCPADTGGTCSLFGCAKSRGPAECVNGKCVCQAGTCANVKGFCDRPPTTPACPGDTGHSCKVFGCHASLGDTECKYGKCLCKEGSCAGVDGTCKPPGFCGKDTGGSCRLQPCYGSRGPSECVDGTCTCKSGFCAKDSGVGYGVCDIRRGQGSAELDYGKYRATVAAVTQEQREFPYPHNKVKVAVCISGGGARALTWAMGALRALESMGLMRHVDAMSSVSGGSWATAIYNFADLPIEELLGASAPPEAVTPEYVEGEPPALGKVVTTWYTVFAKKNALSRMKVSDVYIQYVAQTFLGPFGLGNTSHFMARSAEEVARIKADNPELVDEVFLTPQPGRPKVFVMGGMIGPPVGYVANASNAILLEMSPDFIGSPFYANNEKVTYEPGTGAEGPLTVTVGGGFVESFAFGGLAPEDQSGAGVTSVPPPIRPFSLAKAVGISSMGPSLDLSSRLGLTCAIPRGQLWPVGASEGAQIHELGDAGNMENSGVLAMLQRGAEKLAMWVNTPVPLDLGYDFCSPDPADMPFDGEWIKAKVDVIFSALFGSGVDTVDDGFLKHNQVFPQADLAPTMCAMQKLKKAGKPVVHWVELDVLDNAWWGIQGGRKASVVLVYADKSTEFEAKLPAETQEILPENYPYYDTGLYLTKKQVNILSAQSEYSVRQNEAMFRDALCPQGVAGFCCRHNLPC